MEQFERGEFELGAIEGPSLGRLQTQAMLQSALAGMLSIDAENGALLATAAAAMQSQNAMADDCRAHLLVLHAELDEAYYDRPSGARAAAIQTIHSLVTRCAYRIVDDRARQRDLWGWKVSFSESQFKSANRN